MGKSGEMRHIRRPRCRWEDIIKLNLQGTKWEFVDWIDLAQDTETWRSFVNTVMDIHFPYNAKNILII
jgi:hypothetical protein